MDLSVCTSFTIIVFVFVCMHYYQNLCACQCLMGLSFALIDLC